MTEAAITVREVLRLLLEADSYPCLGNDDWRVADRGLTNPAQAAALFRLAGRSVRWVLPF